ncbi:1,4-alpha-glucan branching protein GlgB [Alteribacillus sp. HJP-4]|uniref:1,4-alpha-glucan branching protein GlgB n=1 Tax=Alteribacillus sp. HJP-4 TaxID=2775394 RepID=UPI0035CD09B2
MENIPVSENDVFLFHQGTSYFSYKFLGSHAVKENENQGFTFSVWAPHASSVGVAGDFNNWNSSGHQLERIPSSGIWSGVIYGISPGTRYKYEIFSETGERLLKADPYAVQSEVRPNTASLTPSSAAFQWTDSEWQKLQERVDPYESKMLIYELHAGTWQKHPDGTDLSYRELADRLIPYILELGYTHIELLPLAEHPFDGSWGYQITGFFSVTSRYGSPDDFKYFVNSCHENNIGVIMDWVPGHFCKDDHGLRLFDGKPLYEYEDSRKAEKSTWGTLTFDFGKPEVQSFLVSNALFWMEEYHIDGLRVDAVASMLYLNFEKQDHEELIVNSYGGEENLEAVAILKKLNETVFRYFPNALMMAEESSAWPLVSAPVHAGGLGFNFKWNMGWMNDVLEYMEMDPLYRKYNHGLLTFSFMYAFSENYVLPFSHDEVVHGKRSLLQKMPGDQWKQFAQLRLLYGYMAAHPGKKLLFMGSEFAQYDEWKDREDLDWNILDFPLHHAMLSYVKALNSFYSHEPAFFEKDHDGDGFSWIDADNNEQSIIAFTRKGKNPADEIVILCNFTPEVRYDFRLGVPFPGSYSELFNSDKSEYGGSGQINQSILFSEPEPSHNQNQSIQLKVPPFAISVLKKRQEPEEEAQK